MPVCKQAAQCAAIQRFAYRCPISPTLPTRSNAPGSKRHWSPHSLHTISMRGMCGVPPRTLVAYMSGWVGSRVGLSSNPSNDSVGCQADWSKKRVGSFHLVMCQTRQIIQDGCYKVRCNLTSVWRERNRHRWQLLHPGGLGSLAELLWWLRPDGHYG